MYMLHAAIVNDHSLHVVSSSSTTYEDLGQSVSVSYTAGGWTGTLSKDYVSVGTSSTSTVLAHLVVIQQSSNFYVPNAEWQGILGMAYSSLAKVYLRQ